MKYPYIGEYMNNVTLFTESNTGVVIINGELEQGCCCGGWGEVAFKNITREYLQNTYGEVVSPEHAEFIVELAELHGFESSGGFMDGCDKYLYTFEDCLEFTSSGNTARSDGEKQITIPLPPKADKQEVSEWKPDFSDLPKHFDCMCNKCGGKCCTGQCEDFPKVGDEILTASKSKAKVLAKHGGKLWIEYINGGKGFNTINAATIQKPKTPEEELRELLLLLWKENNHDFEMFVDVATSHITKKV